MAIELNAELRTDQGKGASRRLRHAEQLPGIVYGAGKNPVNITLLQKDVRAQVRNEKFYSTIVDLNVAGKKEQVIVRAMQHHPYKTDIMHMDFQRIDPNQKLHLHVPLHFLNEEKAPGIKTQGGIVSHVLIEVEIECLPKDIPEYIEVDLAGLNMGESVHLSDLKLPAGVELTALRHGTSHDTAVVLIHAPKAAVEEAAPAAEAAAAPAAPAAE
jgi:large subunit ribosomal protein L25